ncbi:MAG: hypothetical protein WBQ50_03455 [Nocardioides sp.]
MKKLTLLAAGAVGYVFGTRAGRERYEQIKAGANKLAQDPRVRAKANEAGAVIKEQAPIVRDKVVDAAGTAKDAAKDKVSSHSGPDQTAPYPQR